MHSVNVSITVTRRTVLAAVPAVPVVAAIGALFGASETGRADEPNGVAPNSTLWPGFPRQDQKFVREIVGASHSNETRVRELVEQDPALVNAWWDWGFGDWESPLGAASHTGRRSIAEFLIEKGARIDIFAAAMLGHTDSLKAMISANPGVQRTLGPHGITLLAHAKAGGDNSKEATAYLESLGDAGTGLKVESLSDEQRAAYVGDYSYGPSPADRLVVKLDKSRLMIEGPDEGRRVLHCAGPHEFFPAGVPSVRIRFDVTDGRAVKLSIRGRELIASASRI